MSNLTHFLYPSSIFASTEAYEVTTILGSCVAVCLWDPVLRVGGINHFMLPLWNGQGLASPKYGNIAIEKLLDKMHMLGSTNRNLKAKVFGGAEIISTNISQFHIGERNIQVARSILSDLGIPVVSSSVGGNLGRKLIYNTKTGDVMQRMIPNSQLPPYEKQ